MIYFFIFFIYAYSFASDNNDSNSDDESKIFFNISPVQKDLTEDHLLGNICQELTGYKSSSLKNNENNNENENIKSEIIAYSLQKRIEDNFIFNSNTAMIPIIQAMNKQWYEEKKEFYRINKDLIKKTDDNDYYTFEYLFLNKLFGQAFLSVFEEQTECIKNARSAKDIFSRFNKYISNMQQHYPNIPNEIQEILLYQKSCHTKCSESKNISITKDKIELILQLNVANLVSQCYGFFFYSNYDEFIKLFNKKEKDDILEKILRQIKINKQADCYLIFNEIIQKYLLKYLTNINFF